MMRSTLVMSAASALQVKTKTKLWPLTTLDYLPNYIQPDKMYTQGDKLRDDGTLLESDRILKSKFENSHYTADQRAEFFNSIKDREFLDQYRQNNDIKKKGLDTGNLRQTVMDKLDKKKSFDFHLYAKDSYEKIKHTIDVRSKYRLDTERMGFLTVRDQTFLVVSEIEINEHFYSVLNIDKGENIDVQEIGNSLLKSQLEKDSPDNLLTSMSEALRLKSKMDLYDKEKFHLYEAARSSGDLNEWDKLRERNIYKDSNLYKYVDHLIFLLGQRIQYEQRVYNAKIIRN